MIFLFSTLLLLGGCQSAASPSGQLQPARDLSATARAAAQKAIPIVVMFEARWCEFCHILREEVLDPMADNRQDYEGQIAFFRRISIDSDTPLVDFDGHTTTHRTLGERYEIDVTPTVLIFDPAGRVLKRIVGLPGGTVETYSDTLFAAIEEATEKLRKGMNPHE
ncbi:Thioredoxin-related protein [Sulfurivirga caldicuralii]|uniref:Thioredoxin-related protein n=1 Tax=Sulfurivirga caldicuralii TaxID=364032 RepID=A0A1N6DBQ6_9GAMM|nr:thioredoxin fold domain-containing protein [Sulfurivirga caldicuralii]SIN68113.1 Thioredoxin-related protein [Sulfurivirga caldicuralii]